MKISKIISAEGETVDLDDYVDPESSANKGNVEKWLLILESNLSRLLFILKKLFSSLITTIMGCDLRDFIKLFCLISKEYIFI